MTSRFCRFNLLCLGILSLWSNALIGQVLPQEDGKRHEGVASCASSVCHGSVIPRKSTSVLQNEYVVWSKHDAHAQAYKTLLTKESKLMAEKLGLKNAHEADICLDCHADNVSEEFHGSRFQMDDGIGCEACHGGGEDYLSLHTDASIDRQILLQNGLYPTDEPFARAKLCLSCHMGDDKKFATHEIMGAGHPRLSFELDTFTILQPLHFVVDEDYQGKKWAGSSFQTWIMGQVQAAKSTLDLIETRLYVDNRLFPEIALFDCHSCHHPMSELSWSKTKGDGLKPGSIRLNDANFKMVLAITNSLELDDAVDLSEKMNEFRKAIHQKADLQSTIASLRRQLNKLMYQINEGAAGASNEQVAILLEEIFLLAKEGHLADYVAAEQAVMAIDVMLSTTEAKDKTKEALIALYDSVENENKFDANEFKNYMRQIQVKFNAFNP